MVESDDQAGRGGLLGQVPGRAVAVGGLVALRVLCRLQQSGRGVSSADGWFTAVGVGRTRRASSGEVGCRRRGGLGQVTAGGVLPRAQVGGIGGAGRARIARGDHLVVARVEGVVLVQVERLAAGLAVAGRSAGRGGDGVAALVIAPLGRVAVAVDDLRHEAAGVVGIGRALAELVRRRHQTVSAPGVVHIGQGVAVGVGDGDRRLARRRVVLRCAEFPGAAVGVGVGGHPLGTGVVGGAHVHPARRQGDRRHLVRRLGPRRVMQRHLGRCERLVVDRDLVDLAAETELLRAGAGRQARCRAAGDQTVADLGVRPPGVDLLGQRADLLAVQVQRLRLTRDRQGHVVPGVVGDRGRRGHRRAGCPVGAVQLAVGTYVQHRP
ncbi:hypothetical protein PS9374_04655 [Planomonospora sphaerica]|uniref:Uncharacterized protein n=1 Tax=Planomonospora sphaerica TaxID=161355 RepID=A0A171DJI2_9ACTN|nr:hypothetical protein PS9374_04655 [Planomonospora sphaerica]